MPITRISPAEAAAKLLDGITYVDVRSEEEFEGGHPEGAVNVPWAHMSAGGMTPNPDFVAAMNALFAKAEPKVVLGCRSGNRSMRAAEALVAAGWGPLFEQRAGWDGVRDPFGKVSEVGWARAGLPVATGQPEGRSWADVKRKVHP
ncbi:MAG TPA: rhodanese-like domain-containing protein [Polyangiaceae bacterium]